MFLFPQLSKKLKQNNITGWQIPSWPWFTIYFDHQSHCSRQSGYCLPKISVLRRLEKQMAFICADSHQTRWALVGSVCIQSEWLGWNQGQMLKFAAWEEAITRFKVTWWASAIPDTLFDTLYNLLWDVVSLMPADTQQLGEGLIVLLFFFFLRSCAEFTDAVQVNHRSPLIMKLLDNHARAVIMVIT